MNDHATQQTAYPYNATAADTHRRHTRDHGWARPINRMIDRRYAFLNLQYDGVGYLFRGAPQGLARALLNNHFWHYHADNTIARLEQELNVLFCSQDLSDALTLSHLSENRTDAGILIFKSVLFNSALKKKQAAMMATAEPGVVFKYPLITAPLTLGDISHLVVSRHFIENMAAYVADEQEFNKLAQKIGALSAADRLIVPKSLAGDSNQPRPAARSVEDELHRRNIRPAKTVASPYKPSRKT